MIIVLNKDNRVYRIFTTTTKNKEKSLLSGTKAQ